MPDYFSDKEERQYEHVKKGYQEKGNPRAKEIAARTVNKQRGRKPRGRRKRR